MYGKSASIGALHARLLVKAMVGVKVKAIAVSELLVAGGQTSTLQPNSTARQRRLARRCRRHWEYEPVQIKTKLMVSLSLAESSQYRSKTNHSGICRCASALRVGLGLIHLLRRESLPASPSRRNDRQVNYYVVKIAGLDLPR